MDTWQILGISYIYFLVNVLWFQLLISIINLNIFRIINWFFRKTIIFHCPFWMVMIMTRAIVCDKLIFFFSIFEYIWTIHFKWSWLSHVVWDYAFHFLNCLLKASPCANVTMTQGINCHNNHVLSKQKYYFMNFRCIIIIFV